MTAHCCVRAVCVSIVIGLVGAAAGAQTASGSGAPATSKPPEPTNWYMVEQRARSSLAAGDVAGALYVAAYPYVFYVPRTDRRLLLRQVLDAALARNELAAAAQASLAAAAPEGGSHTCAIPVRGLRLAELARELRQKAGLDTADVDAVVRQLREYIRDTEGGPIRQRVASACKGLAANDAAGAANALMAAYNTAEAADTVAGERRAAQMCANLVAQIPNLPPAIGGTLLEPCALLGGSLAGSEVVEAAWVQAMRAIVPRAEDDAFRSLFGAMVRLFPRLFDIMTARPGPVETFLGAIETLEQLLGASGQLADGSHELLDRYWTAAQAADSRELPQVALRATEGALRCGPRTDVGRTGFPSRCAQLGGIAYRNKLPEPVKRQLVDIAFSAERWDSDFLICAGGMLGAVVDDAMAAKAPARAMAAITAFADAAGRVEPNALAWHALCVANALTAVGATERAEQFRVSAASQCVARGDLWSAASLLWNIRPQRGKPHYAALVEVLGAVAAGVLREPLAPSRLLGESRGGSPLTWSALQCTMHYAQILRDHGETGQADALLSALGQAHGAVANADPPMAAACAANLLVAASVSTSPQLRAALLQQASAIGGESGHALVTWIGKSQLADMAYAAGDLNAAKGHLLDLIALKETQRGRLLYDPALRQEWFGQVQQPYELLLTIACEQNDAALALAASEHKRARTFLEQLRERQVDLDRLVPRALRTKRDQLRELRSEVYAALAQGGVGGEADDDRGAYMPIRGAYMPIRGEYMPIRDGSAGAMGRDALLTRLDQLAEQEAAFEAALREQVPGYDRAVAVAPPTPKQLRQFVTRQEGLLAVEYSLARGSYVAVAMPAWADPTTRLVGDAAALDQLVTQFRTAIADQDETQTASASRALYDKLVAPFEQLLAEARTLLIIADGSLHLLPFEALCGPDAAPLITRLPVCYTPSLTVLGQTAPPREQPTQDLLALGNPTFGLSAMPASDGRGAYMPIRGAHGTSLVAEAIRAMAATPLPGTEAEINGIAACFQSSKLLSQSGATKRALLETVSEYRVIHLATHGYADVERPDYSTILLAPEGPDDPGLLQAFELYDVQLNADFVALSACETGVGKTVLGEGVLGLPRAFLFAGAREVLCSLWKVPDQSTAELMQSFYRHWTAGEPTMDALRAAKLELLANTDRSAPFHWAAFILVEGPQG